MNSFISVKSHIVKAGGGGREIVYLGQGLGLEVEMLGWNEVR